MRRATEIGSTHRGVAMSDPIVEPPELYLARVEAAASMHGRNCRHCTGHPQVVSWMEGGELPRAVEFVHNPGCPSLRDLDDAPAAEYVVGESGEVFLGGSCT